MKGLFLVFVTSFLACVAQEYYSNGFNGRRNGGVNAGLDVETRGWKETLETAKKYGEAGAKVAEAAKKYGSAMVEFGGKYDEYLEKGKKGIAMAKKGYEYGSKAKQALNGEGEWGAKFNELKGAAKKAKEAGAILSTMFSKDDGKGGGKDKGGKGEGGDAGEFHGDSAGKGEGGDGAGDFHGDLAGKGEGGDGARGFQGNFGEERFVGVQYQVNGGSRNSGRQGRRGQSNQNVNYNW